METKVDFTVLNSGTRNKVRMRVVKKFSEEIPGTGKGDKASKYIYYVEKLQDNNSIYLTRPAFNCNGYDFVIHVENYIFSNKKTNPKHSDLIDDLEEKNVKEPSKYKELYILIRLIHECHELDKTDYHSLIFSQGYSTELILKLVKWFFIEQDIRYWNYSGRGMLMQNIPRPREV